MLLIFFWVFEFSTTDFDLEVFRGVETVAAAALVASSVTIARTKTTWAVNEPFVFNMDFRESNSCKVSRSDTPRRLLRVVYKIPAGTNG